MILTLSSLLYLAAFALAIASTWRPRYLWIAVLLLSIAGLLGFIR